MASHTPDHASASPCPVPFEHKIGESREAPGPSSDLSPRSGVRVPSSDYVADLPKGKPFEPEDIPSSRPEGRSTPNERKEPAISSEIRQLLNQTFPPDTAELLSQLVERVNELHAAQDRLAADHDLTAAQEVVLEHGPKIVSQARNYCQTDDPARDERIEQRLSELESSITKLQQADETTAEAQLQALLGSVLHVAIATCISAFVAGPVVAWLFHDPLVNAVAKAGIAALITQSAGEIEKGIVATRGSSDKSQATSVRDQSRDAAAARPPIYPLSEFANEDEDDDHRSSNWLEDDAYDDTDDDADDDADGA